MKISRYSKAIDNIVRAFKSKKDELIVTVSIFAISILIASILMYIVENPVQPEVFSSIPKCFYFSIITFTSVGYGDISPISDLGKMLASLLATKYISFKGLISCLLVKKLIHAREINKVAKVEIHIILYPKNNV